MIAHLGSIVTSLMFIWAVFQQYFPYQFRSYIEKYTQRLVSFVYPYIQITFNEFTGERLMRSEAYSAIENYLSSTSSLQAKRLKADIVKNNQSLVLSMDDHEEVADEFRGVKLWWASGKNIAKTQTFSFYPVTDEKRFYKLIFHKRHRDLIIGPYLKHVLKEGRAIKVRNRQRKLYTNNGSMWNHVVFEHPATFQTLAMEPDKKKEIMEDLTTFSKAEEFYSRIGRAWKRGYLLYGPPGTDIDCSLDLTGQRRKKNEKDDQQEDMKDPRQRLTKEEPKTSQVTLSGLLNFIDGLWSACGGERLIVFTTNFVEKLDPALFRKGRMDKHIELSYCGFEAFKVLAKSYQKLESHNLFPRVQELLAEARMTPAEVAEHLMPKTASGDPETCLESLIQALESAKEEARLQAEKEAKDKELSSQEETKESQALDDKIV
ncbi:hypothetical protein REPUB_Repub10bG0039400 [Reevesia pubescens]